jgi:predicted Zn-dependent peptidase
MVFKGTARRSARAIAAEIEGVGGAIDAYTTHEHTSYQVRVPAVHLGRGIDVLSDLAFQPLLRQDDLDLERRVILEEIARVEETPEDLVFELHAEHLYGDHPYGKPILGTRETVESIDRTDLRGLHAQAYAPSNLIVAVAGDVEHEDLVERVARSLPTSPPVERPDVPCPERPGQGTRRVDRPGGTQVHIVVGCPGLEYGAALRHAAVLVSTALGGGMSSRLFQRIREERGLAYSVFSFHSFYRRGGHLGAYVGTHEATAGEAREAVEAELRVVAETGLEPAEIEITKEQVKGQVMLALEAPAARMHRLANVALYDEPYRSLEEVTALIDGISEEDLRAAGALYHPARLAVLELWPA